MLTVSIAVLACGGLILWNGAGNARKAGPTTPGPVASSHGRMVATLASIADKAKRNSAFVGENGIEQLRARAASVSAGDVGAAAQLHFDLGHEELRLGHPDAAVAAFSRLRDLVRDHPQPRMVAGAAFGYGVASLRLAESQNCVARHTSQSCVFPIEGNGVHSVKDGGRAAMAAFKDVLAIVPDDLAARWLLNVAAMTVGEHPGGVPEEYLIPLKALQSDEAFPRFVDVAPALGLNTFDLAGGVVIDDLDGDGLLDIVTSTMDPSGPMHAFRNAGDGTFEDRTKQAGLTGLLCGLNMNHADYDNDGDADILVLRGAWLRDDGRHPNSLLRNDGRGTFTDVTFDAGLASVNYPTQAAGWADYDADGDLDLYIGNEVGLDPYPSQLFRNEGDGTFTDVAEAAGVVNRRFAKAVAWGDYDADGLPDLYVSNLDGPNRLYRNDGDGTFTDVAPALGVTGPHFGFGAWFWDFDNDGALDIYASSYPEAPGPERVAMATATLLGQPTKAELSALYKGDGKGGFRNVAVECGLRRLAFTMGANFGDLDNDGWLDFYLGTGFPQYEGIIPNVMYWNREGKRFADVTTAGGFGHLQKGHAIAFADLDGDGDQDVFAQMGGAFAGDAFGNTLYENPGFGANWLGVHLVGVRSNRSAIGARIRATFTENGRSRSITRWVGSGGSFGASPLRQHLGIGSANKVDVLEIHWPTTGLTQTFRDLAAGRVVRITEGEDALVDSTVPGFHLH